MENIPDETIKNTSIKEELIISLNSAVTETFDYNKLLKVFKNLNITAKKQDNIEFIAIEDEISHGFQEERRSKPYFLKNSKQ